MGRGRAKAKQTKVARKLKYGGGSNTDLSRLAEELGASSGPTTDDSTDHHDEADDDLVERYADYANRQSQPRR
ncbi:MAG: DUF3073 domain-containing protein [Streptosporangiales bacterium]|nr:DUF3073 domain-containing protein [Streptosporangiales bacterium]MBO0891381.1 DUF3073 domain-containing protein [Acidothermales bacterium]